LLEAVNDLIRKFLRSQGAACGERCGDVCGDRHQDEEIVCTAKKTPTHRLGYFDLLMEEAPGCL
jgi:hypothetical protein